MDQLRPARLIRFALPLLLVGGCGTVAPSPSPSPSPSVSVSVSVSVGVSVRTLELGNGPDRPLPTLFYLPPDPSRHPLVVFSHGYNRRPEDYDQLLRTWARAGLAVAAPLFPHSARGSARMDIDDLDRQPADVSAVITAVLALDSVDPSRVAAGGHSLGAMTTMGLITSYGRDKRVGAGIILAGNSYLMGTSFPDTGPSLFFAHGTLDRTVYPEDGRKLYETYPGPKAFMTIAYGNHVAPYTGDHPDHALALATATTDYLRWVFDADNEALKRLDSRIDIESKLS